MTTKADWIRNAAIIFMNAVPGFQLDDAEALVQAHLTNVAGGWVSEEVGDPDGNGHAANNQTESQAATVLIDNEYNNTKTLTYTFKVRLKAKVIGSFPTGTSNADIITALKPDLEERVSELLDNETFEYVSMDYSGATSAFRTTGYLTASDRVAVQAEITGQPHLSDPCAIATQFVRENFNKDTTWMAKTLYKRDQYPIVVIVRKYTNTTYLNEDVSYVDGANTVTNEGYILYVDDSSLQVQTCLISPTQTTTVT